MTSGTAGPFLTEPLALPLHLAFSVANAGYGIWLLAGSRELSLPLPSAPGAPEREA